jgi:hypothetical protein
MPDTKISALTPATTVAAADQLALVQSGVSKSVTASVLRSSAIGAGLSNASVATVSAGYAADTYLAGSAITIPTAGGWQVGTTYSCVFDMVKTAAGTAAFVVVVRMGTLGTTGDANIVQNSFAVGTAAADTGIFEVLVNFRAVGAGTSAVIYQLVQCTHHLAATGLISTGASGTGIVSTSSGGFNSTTQTIIGLSINGGASFSGTNTLVQASALKV